jgi:hypothetical protein
MINGDRRTVCPNAGRKRERRFGARSALLPMLGLARCTGRAQTRPSTTGIREMSVYSTIGLGRERDNSRWIAVEITV